MALSPLHLLLLLVPGLLFVLILNVYMYIVHVLGTAEKQGIVGVITKCSVKNDNWLVA